MTVRELIDKLEEFNDDDEVICPESYEPNLVEVREVWKYDNKQFPQYVGKILISGT